MERGNRLTPKDGCCSLQLPGWVTENRIFQLHNKLFQKFLTKWRSILLPGKLAFSGSCLSFPCIGMLRENFKSSLQSCIFVFAQELFSEKWINGRKSESWHFSLIKHLLTANLVLPYIYKWLLHMQGSGGVGLKCLPILWHPVRSYRIISLCQEGQEASHSD